MCSKNKPTHPNSSAADNKSSKKKGCLSCGDAEESRRIDRSFAASSQADSTSTRNEEKPAKIIQPKIGSRSGREASKSSRSGSTVLVEKQNVPEEKKDHWIEIRLVDEQGLPVPNVSYKITDSENKIHEGSLSEKGRAKVEGLKAGDCKVSFPELDQEVWEYVGVK